MQHSFRCQVGVFLFEMLESKGFFTESVKEKLIQTAWRLDTRSMLTWYGMFKMKPFKGCFKYSVATVLRGKKHNWSIIIQ